MPPTNSLPGGFMNGWKKITDELSHHAHYGQSKLCIPSQITTIFYAMKGKKIEIS